MFDLIMDHIFGSLPYLSKNQTAWMKKKKN